MNRLLRGANDTTFVGVDDRPPIVPAGIRYVITLDADTRLPRDAAAGLVGTMAHPLNRPVYDAHAGRVVDGHGVLQPRITPTLPVGRSESLFQRIFSSPAGADPYALAISDVYQDLFGEGSYTGKGIYDVDTFQAALADRVPENTLLSHDLFEGLFARAALVTDIELFEESPSHYEEAARRQHRWARGDWQLLPWILAGTAGGRDPARIPLISRWKMLDNLRRTLSRPAAWLTLVGAWVLAGSAPLVWTRLVLIAIAVPALIPTSLELLPHRAGFSKRNHLRTVGRNVLLAGAQILLDVALLAHQTWLMTDAIGRTLIRLVVTRRHLLEWVTAAQSRAGITLDLAGAYRRMVGAPILAGVAALLVGLLRPESWILALPFIALWAGSPILAWWISRPPGSSPRSGFPRPRPSSYAQRRGAPGASSKPSWGPRTITCLPTTSRKTRIRSWRIAPRPPTSACTSCPSLPLATSAGWVRSTRSIGSRRRSADCGRWSGSADTSTTGTTHGGSRHSSHATSRRSTAATWLDICWRSRARAAISWPVLCGSPSPTAASTTRSGSFARPRGALPTTGAPRR